MAAQETLNMNVVQNPRATLSVVLGAYQNHLDTIYKANLEYLNLTAQQDTAFDGYVIGENFVKMKETTVARLAREMREVSELTKEMKAQCADFQRQILS